MVSPGSLERLRATNRRAVTSLLGAQGPMSRADLVRGTGLSRSTVSSLVAELIDLGRVAETSARGRPHKGGTGRPPLLVTLAVPSGLVAGVDVGHRHVRVVVADETGEVLQEDVQEHRVDSQDGVVLEQAARMLHDTLAVAGAVREELTSVGMSVPAPLTRRSLRGGTGPGWRDRPLTEELHRRMGVPVYVDNDANLGALGELHRGAARGLGDVVYLKVASGLGAGIVLGGRLHRGATGIAGEIGHVQVREDGPQCRCGGRGCLETLVSVPWVLGRLQRASDVRWDVARVLALDAVDDPVVQRVLTDAGLALGRALADLSNNLNPEALVIGGPWASSTSLRAGVRTSVDRYAQPGTAAAVRVLPSDLGERAEVVGAVALAVAGTLAS